MWITKTQSHAKLFSNGPTLKLKRRRQMKKINLDWDEDGGHMRAHKLALAAIESSSLSEDEQELIYTDRFFKELNKIQRRSKRNFDEGLKKFTPAKKKYPLLRISAI
jgi:hypothetical protein